MPHQELAEQSATYALAIMDRDRRLVRLRAALERLADVCPVTPATLPALDEACAILLETAK
jgi:hypothetical protein